MNGIRKKVYQLGEFLVDRLKLDQPGRGQQELQEELTILSAGSKTAVKTFYVRKVLLVLTILAAGIILSLLCFLIYSLGSHPVTLEALGRPGYGEGDRKEELSVQVEGEQNLHELEVTVQERKYTEKEKQTLLKQAVEELEEGLLKENASLDEVRTDLAFPKVLQDGAVSVSWTSTPYGVIDEDGRILDAEDEEGTLVEIQAVLSCGGTEATHSFGAVIFPPVLTGEEQLMAALRKELRQADEEDSHKTELVLPGAVEGRRLTWMRSAENPFATVLVLTFVIAVCVYLQMDSRVHQKAQERKDQLLLDYPDLMWKITMLLGAGMSIRGVFTRISEEYAREMRLSGKKKAPRYVYEEVSFTCFEMQSGIGEAQAYERFGKRCQLPEYIRIGSVLSQNLKKGAGGLTALLESEAEASLNERKNHARKIGEQAATKLLLPMVLMLGIVLAILMVPAFLSF